MEAPMVTVNMHEAKTNLSKLVDQAAKGETFVIARAGKPMVRVSALDAPEQPNRLGFMQGDVAVPDDFNEIGTAEIAALFGSAG
jgi:prevent-host-death family protein